MFVLVRRNVLRASKAMIDRANANQKIEFIWNSTVEEILFDDSGVTGVKIKNSETAVICERKTDGLFLAIGHTPNTSFLENQINCDDHGFIETLGIHPDTDIPGVFACGDVQDSYYRQAISAAGSGCMAAMRSEKFIEENPL